MAESTPGSGPDLQQGVEESTLVEGQPLLGHVGDQAVMLIRTQGDVYATAATCSHYSGPLAEGLVVGTTVRCPWHHACFDLRTGLGKGPGLTPIDCFDVVREAGLVRIGEKRSGVAPSLSAERSKLPSSVVIVGAGAAGAACAETLRRAGYRGPVTLLGDETPGPVDRPNLSKDYLAGHAPEEWIPLRDERFYRELEVTFSLGDPAVELDTQARQLKLASGASLPYGALLLATGAGPRRLDVPGADLPHVHVLRTLADSRAIIARATHAARAVVVGSSFIGLEAAAALRARGVEVDVVSPEATPLARVVGDRLGQFVRTLHESHGVRFHLGHKPVRVHADRVELDDGSSLGCEFVVVGVGVAPRLSLAERAGLRIERGLVTDERLRTSAPDVYAAGDIALYPDPWSQKPVRIEHWVVAERQGQAVARSMLGQADAYRDVPFFWSAHYDVTFNYVGHAERWDRILERGSLEQRKYLTAFEADGKVLAVVTLGEDHLSLQIEAAMERGDAAEVSRLVRT